MAFVRYAPILVLACALTACGFQLRGGGANGLNIDYRLTGLTQASPMERTLVRALDAAGARRQAPADVHIQITDFQIRQLDGAVNADLRLAQRTLEAELEYRLLDVNGQHMVPDQRLLVQRSLRVNRDNLLGTHAEQEAMQQAMLETLVSQLVRGLDPVLAGRGRDPAS